MILAVTLSKPVSNIEAIMGKPYQKIKISAENSSEGSAWYVELFTKTQVFHRHFSQTELDDFLSKHEGTTFKNCVKRTEKEEITILTNKKGKRTEIKKPANYQNNLFTAKNKSSLTKNYILKEGNAIPFLILGGIMTSEGKVISSKYNKFRQINRFLEFIDDILDDFKNRETPLRIIDFGCGKSYLTFAVHYFLTEIKKIPCKIQGLDLKEEVIDYCNDIVKKLNLKNIGFKKGSIESYTEDENPDIIITLHACDTATDFALKYAVEKNTKVILSVPCCQHQINSQLEKNQKEKITPSDSILEPILKHGFLREKFSSLLTDALRSEWLEQQGYRVQLLEFIDEEHTPKNLLIRAKKTGPAKEKTKPAIIDLLKIQPELWKD